MAVKALKSGKLRFDAGSMKSAVTSSQKVTPLEGIVGQERAVKALQFGLSNKARGFNIYVSGPAGTGKLSAVNHYLSTLARNGDSPSDWCYVYNFRDAYYPKYIRLPKGKACGFRDNMETFHREARQALIKVLQSDDYAKKREGILKEIETKHKDVLKKVTERARQEGFTIKQTVMGIFAYPVVDEKVIDEEAFVDLDLDLQEELSAQKKDLQNDLNAMMLQLRDMERAAQQKLVELEEEVALFTIDPLVNELLVRYEKIEEVARYIGDVKEDLLRNIYEFLQVEKEEEGPSIMMQPERKENKYEVNVLVDNADSDGVPLVMELNPTYTNLFGKVEKESVMGTLYTDFTLIRSGSLHRANGGFLIIPADELLRNMFSYDSLKRALRSQEVEIEEAGEKLGFMTTKSLKPECIPMDLQVILVGEPMLYHMLYHYDKDFRELFKVKADFGADMPASEENVGNYYGFVASLCNQEGLTHFNRSGLVKIAEYGMRMAGSQDKLSTQFGELSDIIRESAFYAAQRKDGLTTSDDVLKAIEQKAYRSNLLQEKIQEMISDGSVFIDLSGKKTGQVNGLAVIDMGDVLFGRPNRITAITSAGFKGVIDIEREAKLGGSLHTKGVLILNGYLSGKFGQKRPVAFTASLVFEQSYGEIEGDSASSTELYALLSSLSGKPVKQGIAVTGSVNQLGEVQPIGGVNEKIEGFFEVCRKNGLTGKQGVMIPRSNVQNLMLKESVVKAVEDGLFKVWAVSTIDEGIEVLTGVKAGILLPEGSYEPGTINGLVEARLTEMANQIAKFDGGNANKGKNKRR
ncbi:MAG: AAA family ATPase [Bacteroidetes bacterium]|nr:AAA family ATPase [Bacteroidota bacterium]